MTSFPTPQAIQAPLNLLKTATYEDLVEMTSNGRMRFRENLDSQLSHAIETIEMMGDYLREIKIYGKTAIRKLKLSVL